jgi:AcrR family transcriptional regulator
MAQHTDNAREKIIDAAEQVVVESGAGHLTFEAVASKSGISRGGLLYHFPDKKALLKGMLDRQIGRIAETRMKKRAEIPEGPERETVAYVLSMLDEDNESKGRIMAAIIAMAAYEPGILGSAAQDYRQTISDLATDGLSFERVAVITLATHGLRLMEVLSISYFNAEERCRIIKELSALAKEPVCRRPVDGGGP